MNYQNIKILFYFYSFRLRVPYGQYIFLFDNIARVCCGDKQNDKFYFKSLFAIKITFYYAHYPTPKNVPLGTFRY